MQLALDDQTMQFALDEHNDEVGPK